MFSRPPNRFLVPRVDSVKCVDHAQKTRFKHFLKRDHLCTRWAHPKTLADLCLVEEIYRLMSSTDVDSILGFDWATYPALTSEFLSSFSLAMNVDGKPGILTFRLGNIDRSLTMAEFNGIYGFPADKGVLKLGDELLNEFWYQLTGKSQFTGRTGLALDIVNPCFRLLQIVLGNVVYARKDCTKMRVGELGILWGMVNAKAFDLGYEIAKTMLSVAHSRTGTIHVGGLITPIALHYKINLDLYSINKKPSQLIDLDHLRLTRVIRMDKKGRPTYRVRQRGAYLKLPSLERTETKNPDNWYDAWVRKRRPPRDDDVEDGTDVEDRYDDEAPTGGPSHHDDNSSLCGQIDSLYTKMDRFETLVKDQIVGLHTKIDRHMEGLRAHVSEQICGLRQRLTAYEMQQQDMHRMIRLMYHKRQHLSIQEPESVKVYSRKRPKAKTAII